MTPRNEIQLFDLFDNNLGTIQSIFYDYITVDTAALIALIPEGRKQLAHYINDEEKLSKLISVGLQKELKSLKDDIDKAVNSKIAEGLAEVKKSWSPFKWSIPPKLIALGGLGVSMWQGSYRWLRTSIEKLISYSNLSPLHTNIKNQLEEICRHVLPADFYGQRDCYLNKNYVDVCKITEREFFSSTLCASGGMSLYQDENYDIIYDPSLNSLVNQLKNCSSSVWASYENICEQLNGSDPLINSFILIGGAAFTVAILCIAVCCYGESDKLDSPPRNKIINKRLASILHSILNPSNEEDILQERKIPKEETDHNKLYRALLRYILQDREDISIREILKKLDLIINKGDYYLNKHDATKNIPVSELSCRFFKSTKKQTPSSKTTIKIDPRLDELEVIIDEASDSSDISLPLLKDNKQSSSLSFS